MPFSVCAPAETHSQPRMQVRAPNAPGTLGKGLIGPLGELGAYVARRRDSHDGRHPKRARVVMAMNSAAASPPDSRAPAQRVAFFTKSYKALGFQMVIRSTVFPAERSVTARVSRASVATSLSVSLASVFR